jgi:hypothetical protein
MEVTSLEQLKVYAGGEVVQLPDFAEGQPFVARLRRPSMMALAKTGKIPNSLLGEAQKLFNGGASAMSSGNANTNMLGDMYDICICVVEAAMMEPTYRQVKEAGLELSDDQILAIFSYTQTGVEGLKQFRNE